MSESKTPRPKPPKIDISEKALIEEIAKRPAIYDKNCKEYRKGHVVESEWADVANELGQTVVNCKKRWKSLRDTFNKYYRLELIFNSKKGSSRRRQRQWVHYEALSFLKNHMDLYRLEDQSKPAEETPNYVADEELLDCNKIIVINEKTDERNIYEIQIRDEDEDEESQQSLHYEDGQGENKEIATTSNKDDNVEEISEIYLLEESMPEKQQHQVESPKTPSLPEKPSSLTTEDISRSEATNHTSTDPDERYLMSCLPAFKRFNAQQKAYVRMAIEKLFYEVEFENVSDPGNKRLRMS